MEGESNLYLSDELQYQVQLLDKAIDKKFSQLTEVKNKAYRQKDEFGLFARQINNIENYICFLEMQKTKFYYLQALLSGREVEK